jgi:hypothetical protein
VRDVEIDQALDRAARAPQPAPAELLRRIADSIEPGVKPVRPLPPSWILVCGLLVLGAAVALLGASRADFAGFLALNLLSRVTIFATLTLLAYLAAACTVAEWIPGSRRRLSTISLVALVSAVLVGSFALVFRDYQTDQFIAAGRNCLLTGLTYAAFAGLLGVWWLRRGWAARPVWAGLAAGFVAGLAGATLLELQCTNFQALHVLVWHTLVLPVSGLAGAIIGRAAGTIVERTHR